MKNYEAFRKNFEEAMRSEGFFANHYGPDNTEFNIKKEDTEFSVVVNYHTNVDKILANIRISSKFVGEHYTRGSYNDERVMNSVKFLILNCWDKEFNEGSVSEYLDSSSRNKLGNEFKHLAKKSGWNIVFDKTNPLFMIPAKKYGDVKCKAYINFDRMSIGEIMRSIDTACGGDFELHKAVLKDITDLINEALDKVTCNNKADELTSGQLHIDAKELKAEGKGSLSITLKGLHYKKRSENHVDASSNTDPNTSNNESWEAHADEVKMTLTDGGSSLKGFIHLAVAAKQFHDGKLNFNTSKPFSGVTNVDATIEAKNFKYVSEGNGTDGAGWHRPGKHSGMAAIQLDEVAVSGKLNEVAEGVVSIFAEMKKNCR